MDYSTLEGITTSLTDLKEKMNSVKKECTDLVLKRDSGDWSRVVSEIDKTVNKIDSLVSEFENYGSKMKTIFNEVCG